MSIAIEAAEPMERFQWLTTEEAQAAAEDPAELSAVTGEHRYPADEFRGRFRRPEREKADQG